MPESASSRIDWAAILAGAVLATAVGLVLATFGAALGLSITSPYEGEGASPALYAIGAGVWVLWIQLVSFTIGGYVAARLRPRVPELTEHETDVRDGMHGLLVWGVGVIAAAIISFATLGGATATANDGTRGSLAASVAQAAGEEIDQAAAREGATNPQAADESASERRAEVARKLTILAAFITAASLLAGAAAAFFAAGSGGHHRDRSTQLKFFVLRTAPAPKPPQP
jgi:hypothetical protein